jgi:hypothetical protein
MHILEFIWISIIISIPITEWIITVFGDRTKTTKIGVGVGVGVGFGLGVTSGVVGVLSSAFSLSSIRFGLVT